MNKKTKLINELKDFTEVIKNCDDNCYNCNIYLTCFEKYSDKKLVNLLNETVNTIESLIQENSFLKLMQQQLIKDIPENELGKKVYNTLKRVDSDCYKKNKETEEN